MASQLIRNDPAHWRRRAEEARNIAEQLDDEGAKATMYEIAQSYDQLADMAEARTPKDKLDGADRPHKPKR